MKRLVFCIMMTMCYTHAYASDGGEFKVADLLKQLKENVTFQDKRGDASGAISIEKATVSQEATLKAHGFQIYSDIRKPLTKSYLYKAQFYDGRCGINNQIAIYRFALVRFDFWKGAPVLMIGRFCRNQRLMFAFYYRIPRSILKEKVHIQFIFYSYLIGSIVYGEVYGLHGHIVSFRVAFAWLHNEVARILLAYLAKYQLTIKKPTTPRRAYHVKVALQDVFYYTSFAWKTSTVKKKIPRDSTVWKVMYYMSRGGNYQKVMNLYVKLSHIVYSYLYGIIVKYTGKGFLQPNRVVIVTDVLANKIISQVKKRSSKLFSSVFTHKLMRGQRAIFVDWEAYLTVSYYKKHAWFFLALIFFVFISPWLKARIVTAFQQKKREYDALYDEFGLVFARVQSLAESYGFLLSESEVVLLDKAADLYQKGMTLDEGNTVLLQLANAFTEMSERVKVYEEEQEALRAIEAERIARESAQKDAEHKRNRAAERCRELEIEVRTFIDELEGEERRTALSQIEVALSEKNPIRKERKLLHIMGR